AAIAMDSTGNFVVAWRDASGARNGAPNGVYAQRYSAAGKANGSQITVVQDPNLYVDLGLAMNDSGGFVVTWNLAWGSDRGGHAQVFNADGTKSGSAVAVTSDQQAPAAAMDSAGNVTFSWTTGSSPDYDVHYRVLTAGGQLQPESTANSTTQGDQSGP